LATAKLEEMETHQEPGHHVMRGIGGKSMRGVRKEYHIMANTHGQGYLKTSYFRVSDISHPFYLFEISLEIPHCSLWICHLDLELQNS